MTTQTKQTDTAQGNRLIAEFMGLTPESELDNRYFDTPDRYYKYDTGEYRITNTATPEDMQYNASWSWLMPVVEKIEHLDPEFQVVIYEEEVEIIQKEGWKQIINIPVDGNSKIVNTYKAVCEFIIWYNEQQDGCPECGQSFFSHNNDGSCVRDQ